MGIGILLRILTIYCPFPLKDSFQKSVHKYEVIEIYSTWYMNCSELFRQVVERERVSAIFGQK